MAYSIDLNFDTVLFDLDGTLLPMDTKAFEGLYFTGLCSKLAEKIDSKKLIDCIWQATKAMILNDGTCLNRDAFAKVFQETTGIDYYENEGDFLEYYNEDFQVCKKACKVSELSKKIVQTLQSKGYRVAIATNPIFPAVATNWRLEWLGMNANQFELVTTFDNSSHAKPNPAYYQEVCDTLQVNPKQCVMIGNDVQEDGVAKTIGMNVKLVEDCLINTKNASTDAFELGSLQDVYEWSQELPSLI